MGEPSLYLGESLGFRAWGIDSGGLTSLNRGYGWEREENLARCLPPARRLGRRAKPHPLESVPAKGCSCGIFAYSELDMAEYYGRVAGGQILGAISGSGRIRVHRHGFRAQRARIIALLIPPWGLIGPAARERERSAAEAADRYRVPLFGSDEIPAFLEYCASREQVEPIPDAERPGRWASIRGNAAGMAIWSLLALVGVLALVHARNGLSTAGVDSFFGEPTSRGFMAALALAAAAAAGFACWRALRQAEELHFFNLLERIGRIDRGRPRPRVRPRPPRA